MKLSDKWKMKKDSFDFVRRGGMKTKGLIEYSWSVRLSHDIANILGAIDRGIKIHNSRKSKWDRIFKPILVILYSIIKIAGQICTPAWIKKLGG